VYLCFGFAFDLMPADAKMQQLGICGRLKISDYIFGHKNCSIWLEVL